MVSIKGFKSQQALQQKLAGYSEDQSIDKLRYTTIQEMSGKRHALDVLMHGAYQITTSPKTIEAGSNIRTIKITGHGAKVNDIVRLSDGTQFAALSIPDANTIITSVELDVSPVGDTCTIWRHINPSYNSDGSLNTSQGPVQFIDNGVSTQVKNDDSVPANNQPLPSAMMIRKDDGNFYPVTLDTTSPYAHTPIPVAITDVTGTTNVTINAGDIAVGIKHNGADPSSVRIGDGTNLAAVSATNALKVDGSAVTQPISNAALNVDTASSGTITGTSSVQIATTNYGGVAFTVAGTWTGAITVELSQDNSTWYTTSYVALASGNTASSFTANTSGQVNVVGYAYFRLKGATVSSGTAIINLVASNKVGTVNMDHPLPAGSNNIGNINNITGTITLPTLAATSTLQTTGNTSLSSIDTKIPGLGQALMAVSTPVVIASNQSAIPVTGTFYQATQPVSGTVAVSNSFALDASVTQSQGTVAAGAAATKSTLTGAVYNSAAPTLTTGQQVALQVDVNGNLKTAGTFSGAVNQGTPAAIANAWYTQVSDGTNAVSVKAASTAVAASDKALVVGISPNNVLKVGDGTTSVTVKAASTAAVAADPALVVALSPNNNTLANSLYMRQTDGTNSLSSIALAAAQLTSGALTAIRMAASVMMGWDGATHRELAVDTTGALKKGTTSGTITQASITVGTSAVRATVAGTAPNAARKRLLISPLKTNTGAIYIGASTVTTATGMEIIGPDRLEFIMDASDFYLISDTAGQAVRIVEVI